MTTLITDYKFSSTGLPLFGTTLTTPTIRRREVLSWSVSNTVLLALRLVNSVHRSLLVHGFSGSLLCSTELLADFALRVLQAMSLNLTLTITALRRR